MNFNRRAFMKMLGAGAALGSSVMVGSSKVSEPVTIGPTIGGVDDIWDELTIEQQLWYRRELEKIRLLMAEKLIIPAPLLQLELMTVPEVQELMNSGLRPGSYKDYLIHWGPHKVNLKEN